MNSTGRRLIGSMILLVALSVSVFAAHAQTPAQAKSGTRVLTGSYASTNPIYAITNAQMSIALYDITGLVLRDYDYEPGPETQVLGTLEGDVSSGTYTLTLPDTPHGAALDFDGDPTSPPDVQIFAPANFIEHLGDEYINRGEGPQQFAIRVEPLSYNIIGGYVVVWTAQDGAAFPAGVGVDGVAFTADDPLLELPAGWSVVALDGAEFTLIRDDTVEMPLVESFGNLHDYGDMSFSDAWEALFARTRETYPFTADKDIDWDAIHDEITPLVAQAESDLDFHLIMARFGSMIPDSHVSYGSVAVLQNYMLGGIGVTSVAVTDAGDIVVTGTSTNTPAESAGLQPGDVLLQIDGEDALSYLDNTPLLLGSASTVHGRRVMQGAMMLQGPVGSQVGLTWRSQAEGEVHSELFMRVMDITGLMQAFGGEALLGDMLTYELLDSGLGYMRIANFITDVSAADQLFADALQELVDAGATGIILDLRGNPGGFLNLALAMAGRFFTEPHRLIDLYYANGAGGFDYRGHAEILVNAPYYDGPVAVLVDASSGSAGDLFAYAMTIDDRALVVGNTPTGGFTGEVSDGQYELPGGLTMQFPTGRPVDPATGTTLLEGTGVIPDIHVPLTVESIVSPEDEVL
jgi:C-terminal processing protease CtpA/Prc